jgi:tetratricopeptide (TPR) repeat protein
MLLISGHAEKSRAMAHPDRSSQRVRRIGGRWLIAILLTFLSTQSVRAEKAQDHSQLGISLARAGRLAEAENELQQAIHGAPGVALYRAQLGSILGLEGKWNEALVSFQRAVELAPTDIGFRRETAAVQWQLGLMSSAEKNLRYVLAKSPGDPGSVLLLGMVKERLGNYEAAAGLLDSQFDLVISQPDRTVALFHSLVRSGQRAKLAKVVDVLPLRRNDPGWPSAISRCTQIAASGGELETAKSLFALISMSEPSRPSAGIQLATLEYNVGQVSDAKQLLLQLVEQGVVSADLQLLLGNCYETQREPSLAMQAYRRAIEAEPARVDAYRDLIALLVDLGKRSEALELVKHAITIAPNDARPWVWKGNLSLRKNEYNDAIESYTHASKLDKSNADAVLGIATVHFVAGQNAAAINQYRAGMTRFPNDSRFYIACAETLLASPDSLKLQREAEDLLRKAAKLNPQSAEAHYQLGQLALQRGLFKDAAAEFALSLQSDPNQSRAHFALSALYRRTGRAKDARHEFEIYLSLKRAEESGMAAPMREEEKP